MGLRSFPCVANANRQPHPPFMEKSGPNPAIRVGRSVAGRGVSRMGPCGPLRCGTAPNVGTGVGGMCVMGYHCRRDEMANIFESLAKELAEVERQTKGVRQLTEHAMASRLLCLYLGWDWYQRHIAFQDVPDEWMHNLRGDRSRTGRVLYNSRVNRLGDAVFTLLKARAKGLDGLKQRFLVRPTKPCFFEAEIASLLAYNGFDVEVTIERGIRGKDFDLIATRGVHTISVEVTAKDDGPLTVQTVRNTLKKKRTQVPVQQPAVIYMRVPAEWMSDLPAAQAIFTEAFVDFFKKSRRLNAVILVWEGVLPFLRGAFTREIGKTPLYP